jgi:hypothetical protein
MFVVHSGDGREKLEDGVTFQVGTGLTDVG